MSDDLLMWLLLIGFAILVLYKMQYDIYRRPRKPYEPSIFEKSIMKHQQDEVDSFLKLPREVQEHIIVFKMLSDHSWEDSDKLHEIMENLLKQTPIGSPNYNREKLLAKTYAKLKDLKSVN